MTGGLPFAESVPSAWRIVPFGRVVDRVQEIGQPDARPLSVFLDQGVVPRDSRSDNFNRLGADLARYLVVKKGDIVFNKLRTWQGGLGVSAFDGIVSPAYFVCRPLPSIEPRYLHYVLRSHLYLEELTRVSKWMPPSQFDISWTDLRSINVAVPSRDTQQSISDRLDRETARINALIAAKRRMVELLEEKEYAELSRLVVPEGCQLAHLRYFATIQGGLTVDATRDPGADPVTSPYLRVANVQAGRLDLDDVAEITVPRSLAMRSTLRPKDVLMTEGGDIDKLGRGTVWEGALYGCLHQNHIFAVRPDPLRLDSWYLALLTQSAHARAYFERTGVQSTNLASTSSSKILDFPIPVIPLAAQREMVSEWKQLSAPRSSMRRILMDQMLLLKERHEAVIAAAVTGQFDIPEAA